MKNLIDRLENIDMGLASWTPKGRANIKRLIRDSADALRNDRKLLTQYVDVAKRTGQELILLQEEREAARDDAQRSEENNLVNARKLEAASETRDAAIELLRDLDGDNMFSEEWLERANTLLDGNERRT